MVASLLGFLFMLYIVNQWRLFIACGWLEAACVRSITLVTGSFSFRNLGAVFFEVLIGVLCLWSLL